MAPLEHNGSSSLQACYCFVPTNLCSQSQTQVCRVRTSGPKVMCSHPGSKGPAQSNFLRRRTRLFFSHPNTLTNRTSAMLSCSTAQSSEFDGDSRPVRQTSDVQASEITKEKSTGRTLSTARWWHASNHRGDCHQDEQADRWNGEPIAR